MNTGTVFVRTALPLIRSRIHVVEAGEEFLPGFQLFPAQGHRPGHAIVRITSSGQVLLHVSDTVGHPLLLEHPAWHWYADARDEQSEVDKAQVLNRAVADERLFALLAETMTIIEAYIRAHLDEFVIITD